MDITKIKNINKSNFQHKIKNKNIVPTNEVFKNYLKNYTSNFLDECDDKKIDNVTNKENKTNIKNNSFTNELLDLEKYSLGLKTLVSIKNKIISAYKEIMGMQM
ncbi:flagellar hook-basal body complex protein FliE [Buchnera aphidicola]|uniref:Uncharacterized protein n=1 Tax=Buchnera aphidicola (Anoecia oenotherae) TaxID=1241833 RepID=A0A4D6XXG8_9GAMM|nr:flagellar hook-basal body complex protein FliE [Buchnera aphidicola]QCI19194.1 hypothetical protein D9V65_00290 [Buchnera aphidicola (Anoecia oenotherae)]